MKKNSILSVVTIALYLAIAGIISCSKTSNHEIKKEQELTIVSKANLELRNMPKEVNELKELKDEIAKRVIGNGVSKSLLENAIKTQNDNEIKRVIKMSDNEYNEYSIKLLSLKEKLLSKYPQIQEEINLRKECKSCNLEKSSLYLTNLANKNPSKNNLISFESFLHNNEELALASRVDCEWVKYTACLLICTSTGPILYWLCAALCVDTYCRINEQ